MANSATQTQLSCPANASKKSYIKACQRAARDGVAKYRGLYLKPNELGMKEVSSTMQEVRPHQPAKKRSSEPIGSSDGSNASTDGHRSTAALRKGLL